MGKKNDLPYGVIACGVIVFIIIMVMAYSLMIMDPAIHNAIGNKECQLADGRIDAYGTDCLIGEQYNTSIQCDLANWEWTCTTQGIWVKGGVLHKLIEHLEELTNPRILELEHSYTKVFRCDNNLIYREISVSYLNGSVINLNIGTDRVYIGSIGFDYDDNLITNITIRGCEEYHSNITVMEGETQ